MALLKHLIISTTHILQFPHVVLVDDLPLSHALFYHFLPLLSMYSLNYRGLIVAEALQLLSQTESGVLSDSLFHELRINLAIGCSQMASAVEPMQVLSTS